MELLLSKILNYESEIFCKYINQRLKMKKYIKQIKINNLDNTQLLLFIDNLKSVLDPLKVSTENMENFLKNPYQKNENINQNQFLLFYLLFGNRFFEANSSELIEDVSTLSEHDPDSVSDSLELLPE